MIIKETGIICGYYANTNEALEVIHYQGVPDRTEKWHKVCETIKAQGRGGTVYVFSNNDFNCDNFSNDEIAKLCAINTIKTLVKLNWGDFWETFNNELL